MAFNQPLGISSQDIYTVQPVTQPSGNSFVSDIKPGQIGETWDGRKFVFAQNGAVQLGAGLLTMTTGSAVVSNHLGRTLSTAQAVGSTTVAVPLGATAATLNQYSYGYLVVVSGTGKGQLVRIKGNTAAASSGTTTVTLFDPLFVALDTTSVVSLYVHPASSVVVSTTSSQFQIIGSTLLTVPISNYFWAQVQGIASVQNNGGIAANTGVVPSATTAGNVDAEVASTITQRVGFGAYGTASTTTQYQPIVLSIQL